MGGLRQAGKQAATQHAHAKNIDARQGPHRD